MFQSLKKFTTLNALVTAAALAVGTLSPFALEALAAPEAEETEKEDKHYEHNDPAISNFELCSEFRINEEFDKALDKCNEAIEIDQNIPEFYVLRGLVWFDKGNYDSAIEDFSEAIELDENLAVSYFYRGFALSIKGEILEALGDCATGTKLDPNDSMGIDCILFAKAKQEEFAVTIDNIEDPRLEKTEFEKALEKCNDVIDKNKDSAEAYFNRGNVFFENGDIERAHVDYERVTRLDSEFTEVYNARCRTNTILDNYGSAVLDCTEAIRLEPDNTEAYFNRAKALAKYSAADFRFIEVMCHKLTVEGHDPSTEPMCQLAQSDPLQSAVNDYTTIIELEPDNASAYLNRADVWHKIGDIEKSNADFKKAAEIDPGYTVPWILE